MNTFYVITNRSKDESLETTKRIQKYIEEKGKRCVLAEEGHVFPKDTDCVLTLGGDGTLIRAARELQFHDVPILGVNIGTLGYLTEVEIQNVETAIEQLIHDRPVVEARMMLKGIVNNKVEDIALNDIVLTRFGKVRVIHFNIYVNGQFLNSYRADGIIISTPTGSTAYNLSAGGPIVEPNASMIVITPICSHALNARSMVFSAEDEIVLEVAEGRDGEIEEAGISFDGDRDIVVHTGDRIVIRKAKETTKLLKLSKVSFLETLSRKMKGN